MATVFTVTQGFKAKNAISGHERWFKPGETLVSDSAQTDEIVTLEIDKSFFLIERPVFEACCKRDIRGPGPW